MCDAFIYDLLNRFPLASGGPPSKTFPLFIEAELLAFIGNLIAAGVHRQNKENLNDTRKGYGLPLMCAAMLRDQFKMLLRFIKFDYENTRAERAQTAKSAPIRDMWIMLNRNLEKAYKPISSSTNNYFHLEAILNLHSTYHLNLLNMALRFSGLAMHQKHTQCKVRFTLENQ